MRRSSLCVAIAILAASAAARAADTPADWQRKPTPDELKAAWPADALRNRIEGGATLGCVVTVQGTLRDCVVVDENPKEMNFGAAALSMTSKMSFTPATHDGKPVESRVRVPVSFRAPRVSIYTGPDWKRKPTADQLLAVWPREALRRKIEGGAMIECVVTVQGTLRDCKVLSEDPPNMYFGMAAMAMTPQFLFKPATLDGKPIEHSIRLPVNFRGSWSGSGSAPAPTGSRVPGDEENATGPGVVSNVQWLTAPTYADVVTAYPEKAKAEHVGGNVGLSCRFKRDGVLGDCDVLFEQPRGYGFGAAARRLARSFAARVDKDHPPGDGLSTQVSVSFAPAMLDGTAPVIGKPQWARLPEMLDMAQNFPAAARAAHVSTGHVSLTCTVGPGGRLADCAVLRADPEGLGFGEAALALAPQFRLSVWTSEGLPTVGGRVTVPLRYEAPVAGQDPAKGK